MSRLPDSLSKKERRAVEDCTKSIVNKLLHGCMASLRCDGSDSAVGPADHCCSPWHLSVEHIADLPPWYPIMLYISSHASSHALPDGISEVVTAAILNDG